MTYGVVTYGGASYGSPGSPNATAGLTIEERIERALFESVAALQLDGAPLIAWPNVAFAPASPKTTHLRVEHFRNANTRLFLGSAAPHLRQGILQLTVVAPLAEGPSTATWIAASIADQYPADLMLYSEGLKIRIQRAPDVMTAEKTDTSWSVRVDVYYDSHA